MHPKKHHDDQQQQRLQSDPTPSPTPPPPPQPQQFTFGSSPISIKCPFCHSRIKTEIILKPQLISIMLGLVMFTFVPNAVMIVLVVIVLQISATKRHRCPLCERELGTDGKFLVFFKDQVYSLSFGENGVLISKKILVTVGLFLLMVFAIYVRATVANTHQWIDLTWDQLVQKCPRSTKIPKCNSQNLQKTIKNWKGHVMRVQDRRDSLRRYYDYALQLYIKMTPTQTSPSTPDLYLTSSTSKLFQMSQLLDNLNHGDQIIFNATFYPIGRGIGEEAENRHLQIVDLGKTGNRDQMVEVFMKRNQEVYFQERVEGGGLRKEG